MAQEYVCYQALLTTADKKLKRGRGYWGEFVYAKTKSKSGTYWRIRVKDETGKFASFDPDVFVPYGLLHCHGNIQR